jgi:O-antigen/teichoic acid export membrane protein
MGTMPIFAKLDTDNKDRLKGLFYRLLRLNTLIYSIISIIIVIFSYYFIPLIYGDEYFASVLPLQILTIFLICITFAIFLSLLLDYQGLAKKRAFYLSIVMMLGITLNFILIPAYGAVGAAIATSLSFLPYIFLCLFEVKKILN